MIYRMTVVLFISLMVLYSCGKNDQSVGSNSRISGTAAAGKGIDGVVRIKDRNNTVKIADIDSKGRYDIDLGGLVPPLVLKAEGKIRGKQVAYVSVATAGDIGGKVNITPVTDLVAAILVKKPAVSLFNQFNPDLVTESSIRTAMDSVSTVFSGILKAMGLTEKPDFMHVSFSADGTGIDAFLAITGIDVAVNDSAQTMVTIINKATGDTVTGQLTSLSGLTPLPVNPSFMELVTAFLSMEKSMDILTTLYKTAVPDKTNSTLTGQFADSFMDSGFDKTGFCSRITTGKAFSAGMVLSNLLVEDITHFSDNEISISFDQTNYGAVKRVTGRMKKEAGTWKYAGNGRMFDLSVRGRMAAPDPALNVISGLDFYFKDENNRGASLNLASVRVTGPWLPASGLKLIYNSENGEYDPVNELDDSFLYGGLFQETDGLVLNAIPDSSPSTYIFTCYTGTGAVIPMPDGHGGTAPYTVTVTHAKPYPVATLTGDVTHNFPVIVYPSMSFLSEGKTSFEAAWAAPANFSKATASYIRISWVNTDFKWFSTSINLPAGATRQIITLNASSGFVNVALAVIDVCYSYGELDIVGRLYSQETI
jgi:hypothetical protein